MFDAATASLLRAAPGVPGLDTSRIPSLLTRHYANLVSARLRGDREPEQKIEGQWSLERLADTYELIASVHKDVELRRAAAFVAGTAQQILARRVIAFRTDDDLTTSVDRDHVDPFVAAPILFLAAEQYADANEAASALRLRRESQLYESRILAENIADLAGGRLVKVLDRAGRWRRPSGVRSLEEQALGALLEALITGIELLAGQFLSVNTLQESGARFGSPREAFDRVLALSARSDDPHFAGLGPNVVSAYAGPRHLASLLRAASEGLENAALVRLPPPEGADHEFWNRWLSVRARECPFVWPNHRAAIAKGFHETGQSAVVILPTGAGKTTVSSLKIAGTLAQRKSVIFLVPTHALVDQLTEDLQKIFPKDLLGSVVSSDFDLLFQRESQLREIEVMTPERCLAMISFAPEAFSNVGLLVFDECHILSPDSGKIRRALDGMLCVLGFNHVAPQADMLFLSAMLQNGEEFGAWISDLTDRPCVCVDLLWKPSRQARGVIIYKDDELDEAQAAALSVQREKDHQAKKRAKNLRKAAAKKLKVKPWAIWGLKHNWLDRQNNTASIITSLVQDQPVTLAGTLGQGEVHFKPNANQVAASLAITAAKNGLKSIIFVNTKTDAVTTARYIATELAETIHTTESESARWNALEAELGGLAHSVLSGPSVAVPHNSAMLPLERKLAEEMFRRESGAKVIVATPTLAQGLNLPAHFAILAGDRRADPEKKGRQDLAAHEILNAAARAGRAGHLANGIVLLVPEPIMSVTDGESVKGSVVQKLKSILPEDDRCISVSDPLEIVLDRLMQGDSADPDVRYVINRMTALGDTGDGVEPTVMFNVRRSFGAYMAHVKGVEETFDQKIRQLKAAVDLDAEGTTDFAMAALASQSGLPTALLERLQQRIADQVGVLPTSVEDWVTWTVQWLIDDEEARLSLLQDVKSGLLGASGRKKSGPLTTDAVADICPGLLAWVRGKPIREIENALGGAPDENADTKRTCPRARELIASVIPRAFSFIVGLISHVVERVDPFEQQPELSRELIEILGTAVRRGFDLPELVDFASKNPQILSRVQVHEAWVRALPF